MKLIPLTQGKFTKVSERDYKFLAQFKWRAHKDNRSQRWYAARTVRYPTGTRVLLMHRVILQANTWMQVDHKDRNGLNNSRSNLRACTRSQNQGNRGIDLSKKTSKYKGVCFCRRSGKWKADIANRYLGRFATEKEAALRYDEEAKKLYGVFANLNFKVTKIRQV